MKQLGILLYALLFLCVFGSLAQAQASFRIPETPINIARYQTVDECRALGKRLLGNSKDQDEVWSDTTPMDFSEDLSPVAPDVLQGVRACVRRFSPSTVSIQDAPYWVSAFLQAGQDSAADTVIQRMRAHEQNATQASINFVDLWTVYGNVRPVRWDKIKQLVAYREAELGTAVLAKVRLYDKALERAIAFGDTAFARFMASRCTTEATALNSVQRDSVSPLLFRAMQYLHERQLLDSLAVGVNAYTTMYRSLWDQAKGKRHAAFPYAIGDLALPIVGSYWYRSSPPHQIIPLKQENPKNGESPIFPHPGRVTLVFFNPGSCLPGLIGGQYMRRAGRTQCWQPHAAIRRLAHDFPNLDVVLVARTYGAVGTEKPLDPESESNLLAKILLDYYRIPGILAVEQVPFFRLGGLDQRIVDEESLNVINYGWNKTGEEGRGDTFLIDANGVIVGNFQMERYTEWKLRNILHVIFHLRSADSSTKTTQ